VRFLLYLCCSSWRIARELGVYIRFDSNFTIS